MELMDPFTALTEVDGATVLVSLMIPGNEAYREAVDQATATGQPARAPTGEEVARAVECWRRDKGDLAGFRKERRPTEVRTLWPERTGG